MLFKIIGAYALMTLFIGSTEGSCDGKDMLWSDIGDDATINIFFSQVCSNLTSDSNGDFKGDGCFDVGQNHIDAEIDFNVGNYTTYSATVCQNYFKDVKRFCEKGGSLFFWSPIPIINVGGSASAYPKPNNCNKKA